MLSEFRVNFVVNLTTVNYLFCINKVGFFANKTEFRVFWHFLFKMVDYRFSLAIFREQNRRQFETMALMNGEALKQMESQGEKLNENKSSQEA
jgi:hypothetical protein